MKILKNPFQAKFEEARENANELEKQPMRSPTPSLSDQFDTIRLSSILESKSRLLSSIMRFPSDERGSKEDSFECDIGNISLENHMRMYAELSLKGVYLGSLYRKDGEMVFEATGRGNSEGLLFSRESFNHALERAALELDQYDDATFSDSSSGSEAKKSESVANDSAMEAEHAKYENEGDKGLRGAFSNSLLGMNGEKN